MALAEDTKLLAEAARSVAVENSEALKIVIVDHVYAAGVLTQLLIRNHHVSKGRITQLGYTASDEQNAALLRRANPVVIVAKDILLNRSCVFFPPADANDVAIIDATEGKVRTSHQPCGKEPFELKGP